MTALSAISFKPAIIDSLPETLQDYSRQSKERLAFIESPTRKTEGWQYSAKRLGLLDNYNAPLRSGTNYEPEYELDCHTLIIENGQIQAHSVDIPGVSIKRFEKLTDAESLLVKEGVVAASNNLQFAAVNSAYFGDGLFLNIEENIQVSKPIKVVFLQSSEGMSFPRIFLRLEEGASACLLEEVCFIRPDLQHAFSNSVFDVHVEKNARLQYLRMNQDQGDCKHIGATGVLLKRDAHFESYCMALGSQMARHDLHVKMVEPGATCDLKGVCVTRDKQHFDNHTCVDHVAPHCTSDESYRCIADHQSQIVFNGRIHIHPQAQKSLGSMSNKNLLLSSEAEIDSKPELEIYADDVKCAHGTTIGQLNENELYYLKTRGLSQEQARLILTQGFVLELVRACPLENLAKFWEEQLTQVLCDE